MSVDDKCPFRISYSCVGVNSEQKQPHIYYQVKITKSTKYMHTCDQSSMSHRQALISSGTLQPNIQGVQDIIAILRQNPLFPTKDLRPF